MVEDVVPGEKGGHRLEDVLLEGVEHVLIVGGNQEGGRILGDGHDEGRVQDPGRLLEVTLGEL